jgi:hypothetical protein
LIDRTTDAGVLTYHEEAIRFPAARYRLMSRNVGA